MRDRLIELCEIVTDSCKSSLCADCEHNNIDYPHCMSVHFADYLLANGVVVIRCNIGDVVYQTDGVRIYELTILDVSLYKNKPYYETDEIDFDDDAIGKSIFLTRQEAEAKLKGEQ